MAVWSLTGFGHASSPSPQGRWYQTSSETSHAHNESSTELLAKVPPKTNTKLPTSVMVCRDRGEGQGEEEEERRKVLREGEPGRGGCKVCACNEQDIQNIRNKKPFTGC